MILSRLFILIFLQIIVWTCLTGQINYVQGNKNYSTSKIYLSNNKIITVKNMMLNGDTIRYNLPATSIMHTKSVNEVKYVRLKDGTHAIKSALYGAGVMSLVSLYALSNIAADPSTETKDNAGIILLGFIGGGAVIGGLIGLNSPKWKRFYFKPSHSKSNISFNFSSISPASYNTGMSILLTF